MRFRPATCEDGPALLTLTRQIKAFDRAQLSRFLDAAANKFSRFHALFFVMSRTGLRLGEVLALNLEDIDFVGREIRVVRAISTRRPHLHSQVWPRAHGGPEQASRSTGENSR